MSQKNETVEKEQHTNIYAALSAFQGELKPMAKTGEVEFPTKSGNGKVKFSYTPLGEIMATIYPLLAKHGLSVRHEVTKEGVEAILTHETYKLGEQVATKVEKKVKEPIGGYSSDAAVDQGAGRYREESTDEYQYVRQIEGEIRSGIVKIGQASEMKDTGAAITYARRYTLTMVLGISSEDDKDAELLEQSAKNAIQTVYDRFKAGVEKAKTTEEVEKSVVVLKKDLATIEAGKAPALGLSKEQYEELIRTADQRINEIESQG